MSRKLDIISLFRDDYAKSISGREIARLSGMNHQTALNHLNELKKHRIVSCSIKGRNKEYKLMDSYITKSLLVVSEISASLDAEKEIHILMEEILPFAESIIIFGSFAVKEHRKESDIDLIVLGKAKKKKIEEINKRYSRQINTEYISYDDFAKTLKEKKPLAIEILKKHLIFGDVSKIVDIWWRWHQR